VSERLQVTVDGVRLVCHASGAPDAPALVLLHGLGDDASVWEMVGEDFAQYFRVLAIDLRGHGLSDQPGVYSFELMRDDVLGVLDQLGLDRVSLLGHSMGGSVAYLIAEKGPGRIERLIVEDTAPPWPWERTVPERPREPVPFDWAVVPAIYGQLNHPDPAWWDQITEITAPTLIIGGGPDSHVPQDKLEEAAARLPNGTLQVIPAGHHVHAERPAEFTATVLGFLRTGPLRRLEQAGSRDDMRGVAVTGDGKLVRDKIPQIIRDRGDEPIAHVADATEYRQLLLAKLTEETDEVLAADDADMPEELADVLEVVLALALDLGLDATQLEELRQAKAAERGGFAERIVWLGIAGE
jgi:3-oxoadipate enol-lactonase